MRAIGCDGGGSGARLALLWDGARHDVTGGPANVMSDRAGALSEIRQMLEEVAALAGIDAATLGDLPAHFALAGVIDGRVAAEVFEALGMPHAVVEEDRRAAVRGALGDRAGHVVGLGTGSYFARQGSDGFATIGGHGLVLGDEASGAWVGREVLRAVLAAADGLGPQSWLTQAVAEELGGVAGTVSFARAAEPAEFARLAPRVFDAPDDPVAGAIIARGVDYLARGLAALGWSEGGVLCLTGGLGRRYVPHLPPGWRSSLARPEGTALDGALALAMERPRGGT